MGIGDLMYGNQVREGSGMTRYFVREYCGKPKEVSYEEYRRLYLQQFMGTDVERIIEQAKKDTKAVGTTLMFWTE